MRVVRSAIVGVTALLAGAGVVAQLPANAAPEVTSAVTVIIDRMGPLVATADGTLTISGRVVNTSREEMSSVAVQLRRSSAPLTSRRELTAVTNADSTETSTDPIALPGTQQQVATTLSPGGRANFAFKIPFSDLALPTDGTYALSVEALGRDVAVDSVAVRKGIVRTFLPWYPDPHAVHPVSLVWLWPLVDWPARSPSGVLLDDRTPTELAPGGRLDTLLKVGNRNRGSVSWIADPALLQTAAAMTDGYQVLVGGELTVGSGEQDARRWLDALTTATAQSGLRTLPYADVDAAAVVRAGMEGDVVRAVTTGPAVAATATGHPAPGGLYWAPFGRIDRKTSNVLASAGVGAVVLSAAAMPATDAASGGATASLATSFGAIRALLADPGLSQVLSTTHATTSDVILARQRFLAETALLASSIPSEATDRSVVVAPQNPRWDPPASLIAPLLRATRTAPWLESGTLDEVLAQPPSASSRDRRGYGERAKSAELSQGYMQSVGRLSARLASFTSIIDNPSGVSESYSAAILRAESAAWRTDLPGGRRLITSIGDQLSGEMGLVHVLSEGTITFSGDSGRVPVTIANELDRSVTVGVTLVGQPELRLVSDPLPAIAIEPGKFASVDIDARVIGGDPLTVEVQLLDGDKHPYGKPAVIVLSSTAYARAAAWVTAAAFLAIVIFVVVGVTRRIRKAHASRAGAS